MALSEGVSFMFCDFCGTMLSLNSMKYVECPLCKFKKSAAEVSGREISYKVTAEDMRKELGISNFEGKTEVKDMEINKNCEKCSNTKLKFSTRQMRSADEGQTTFYHCTKCLHTFSEN
ncbi:DNA-directed RNA polymerase I subunit RPA12 [Euphorbia lathyris]|uniref:DNA-directed RNA polymerase I subunit RPA12 n=1 Tax=Euphorbia lathyris TaxID=212925 RepID=UPI003313DA23